MVLDNLMNYHPGITLDGIYISANATKLLFEPEWNSLLAEIIGRSVRDSLV